MDTRIQRSPSALSLILALVLTLPALGADQHAGSLTVTQPWARATPPGATTGAAYFELINAGGADILLRIESPVAREVEMHLSHMDGGIMQMRPMSSVNVPEHGRVRFAPEGLHVMLFDLRQPLRENQHFPMTLVFQRAGSVRVEALVLGIGATANELQ